MLAGVKKKNIKHKRMLPCSFFYLFVALYEKHKVAFKPQHTSFLRKRFKSGHDERTKKEDPETGVMMTDCQCGVYSDVRCVTVT